MHFEILVEDQSGQKALAALLPKILGEKCTWKLHSYKGVGNIPRNWQGTSDPNKRILLDRLPKLLRGYGKTFSDYYAAVIIVCDLDKRCLKTFRSELLSVLNRCDPAPETRFCIAIQEGESWFLGDQPAIRAAYPKAKADILKKYRENRENTDGTWEKLADAVYPGGANQLKKGGWQMVGAEKSKWAKKIAPLMNVAENKSPSFVYFRDKLRELALKNNGK